MSVGLLDVNILIALAWPSHLHHRPAQAWFAKHASRGWATCPLTQCAFVRISSNPKIIPEAVRPAEALELLRQILALKHHTFWPDNIGILDERIPSALLVGHRQITDAYLLGLAVRHGGRLVTLDKGLLTLAAAEPTWRNAIELVAP